jgi:hypothetical protein
LLLNEILPSVKTIRQALGTAVKPAMCKYFVSFMLLLSLLVLGFAEAQQLAKVYRVGVLSIAQSVTRLSTDSTALKGLRDGLKEAGYVEGKILVLDIPLQKAYDELRSVAG